MADLVEVSIDRKVRTAFLKFHRGDTEREREGESRRRYRRSRVSRSIKKDGSERIGRNRFEEQRGKKKNGRWKIATVKNNEDVFESGEIRITSLTRSPRKSL